MEPQKKILLCPTCQKPLAEVVFQGLAVNLCYQCRGFLVDSERIDHPSVFEFAESEIPETSPLQEQNKEPLLCPHDGSQMSLRNCDAHPGLFISLCSGCKSGWFDARSLSASMKQQEQKKVTRRSILTGLFIAVSIPAIFFLCRLILVRLLGWFDAETLKGICIASSTLVFFSLCGLSLSSQDMGSCASGGCCASRRGIALGAAFLGENFWKIITALLLFVSLLSFLAWKQHPDKKSVSIETYLQEASCNSAQYAGTKNKEWEKLCREADDLLRAKKDEQVLAISERAIKAAKKSGGKSDLLVAESLKTISIAYLGQQKYAESESALVGALALQEGILGLNHWEVANTLRSLAESYKWRHHYPEAEMIYKRLVAIDETKEVSAFLRASYLPEDLRDLGWVCQNQKKYADAERFYKQALAFWQKRPQNNHVQIATTLKALAALYRDTGRLEEAEEVERQVVKNVSF